MNELERPVLALTPGEPAGIGPDIAVHVAASRRDARIAVVADPELLSRRARLLGLKLTVNEFDPRRPAKPGTIECIPVSCPEPVVPGQLNVDNALYVLKTLDVAIDAALSGRVAGLVTGPVQKSIINDANVPFTGHTEYLAERTGADPVMMLVCPQLRVALATTHVALKDVSAALSAPLIEKIVRIIDQDLRERFAIPSPRILVCGVNPHAGEDGHIGREEVDWLRNCLDRLRATGMRIDGPSPADTAFVPSVRAEADAVLAMYHDQGLPVLKALGFGDSVNVTLGLPIIRTSVDHGTALDIAGTGKADPSSLLAALKLAAMLARQTTLNPQ
ncbi:MAG: 4-hydroxythreonine-4-phosphate dehydrogenase PdxA [Chromatiales bacterium]|jgi:4-hydroxythreonine-4-phosphate dehydrogenase|nr:4-hydroxythreonine-4-phosphate dehydrogenase PdxA [Chromatiales bacterium]